MSSGGKRADHRIVTVMFADMVGFSSYSSKLSHENLQQLLSAYQSLCQEAVGRFGGLISRYEGDGVMCQFGYPEASGTEGRRAVAAALHILDGLQPLTLGERIEKPQVRVGIATGEVIAGITIGEHASEQQAVIGLAPTLARRLQSIANPDEIVICGETKAFLDSSVGLTSLGPQSLKGIDGGSEAWRVEIGLYGT